MSQSRPIPTKRASRISASPDFSHLLASNDPPLESEIQFIAAVISDDQGTLDQLQVAAVPANPLRNELIEHIRQHRAIISPIRRVPPELICEIFALTVPNSSLEDEDAAQLILEEDNPWLLSQICRTWRQCALACPAIWSFIVVPFTLLSEGGHRLMSKLEIQLLRSADAPLHILWQNIQRNAQNKVGTVLDLVLLHCNRWRILQLHVSPHTHGAVGLDWLQPVDGNLGRLEMVKVGDGLEVPDVFSKAPNLRGAILTDLCFTRRPWAINIPWTQIQYYRGSYGPERQLEILTSAPNLRDCGLGFNYAYGNFNPYAHPSVMLPHLRRLTIQLPTFLHNITAPLLEDLCTIFTTEHSIRHLLPFVERSACTIKTLILFDCTITANLITALRGLPSLTHLVVECGSGFAAVLFQALTLAPTLSESDIAPSLTSFVYEYRILRDLPAEPFLVMARSRFSVHPCRTTRLARLRIYRRAAGAGFDPVQVLRDEGFDAAFLTSRESHLLHNADPFGQT